MNIYKIRRISDGKFSTGGRAPRWTNRGNTWTCIGHVKAHLTMLRVDQDPYEGCEVVEFVLSAQGIRPIVLCEVV